MLIYTLCSYLLPKRLFGNLSPNTASFISSQLCHISRTLITLTFFFSPLPANIGVKSRSARLSAKRRRFSHLYLSLSVVICRLAFHLCAAVKVLVRHFNFPLENQIE